MFPFVNLSVKDNPAKQEGYCNLFSGFASTIRNTLAHSSDDLDDIEALY
ncbi:MAG: TIGR02391 family protein [bacterium]